MAIPAIVAHFKREITIFFSFIRILKVKEIQGCMFFYKNNSYKNIIVNFANWKVNVKRQVCHTV